MLRIRSPVRLRKMYWVLIIAWFECVVVAVVKSLQISGGAFHLINVMFIGCIGVGDCVCVCVVILSVFRYMQTMFFIGCNRYPLHI